MSKDQRTQSFESIAHNIVFQTRDYNNFKNKILTETNKTKSSIHDYRKSIEYPGHIE